MNPAAPLVSVVLPTHDRRDLFAETLASVVAQTFDDLEVIVVEDGGPAYGEDVAAALGDRRVRVLRLEDNRGVAAAVRAGLECASGDYVAFANDDDPWEPGLVATLIPPLQADPTVTVAFGDHHVIDADGSPLPEATERNTRHWGRAGLVPGRHQPFVEIALVDGAIAVGQCALFRRDAVPAEDLDGRCGDVWDRMVSYLACRDGGAAWYVPERLASYRSHAASLTHTRAGHQLAGRIFVYRTAITDERLAPWRRTLGRILSADLTVLAVHLAGDGDVEAARTTAAEATGLVGSTRSWAVRLVLALPRPVPTGVLAGGRTFRRRLRSVSHRLRTVTRGLGPVR